MAREQIIKTRKGYLAIHPSPETRLLAALFDSHIPNGPARRKRRIDEKTATWALARQAAPPSEAA